VLHWSGGAGAATPSGPDAALPVKAGARHRRRLSAEGSPAFPPRTPSFAGRVLGGDRTRICIAGHRIHVRAPPINRPFGAAVSAYGPLLGRVLLRVAAQDPDPGASASQLAASQEVVRAKAHVKSPSRMTDIIGGTSERTELGVRPGHRASLRNLTGFASACGHTRGSDAHAHNCAEMR